MKREYPEEALEFMRYALREVAQQNQEDPEKLRELLGAYIAEIYANPDPVIRAELDTCPRKGEHPTPEEFLLWFLPQTAVDWEDWGA